MICSCYRPEQMRRIEPYFPLSHGVPRLDDRRVLSGILFVIRDGLRWRDAPVRAWFSHSATNSKQRHQRGFAELVHRYLSRCRNWPRHDRGFAIPARLAKTG
ncbi:transposase [Allomesorhizobium alhagi]|uniref:Transposase n=1 Tax=Mesorhizobium alhagi CCNWXJ12-2 TaxID=1107882 RepID=H0HX43_9HYPH|nr:transposase [Mesorhizobium alhagi CCNWXJ12-2]